MKALKSGSIETIAVLPSDGIIWLWIGDKWHIRDLRAETMEELVSVLMGFRLQGGAEVTRIRIPTSMASVVEAGGLPFAILRKEQFNILR
jgi:hypothetical protein